MSKQVSLDSKADKAVVDDLNVEVAATKMLGGLNSDIAKLTFRIDLMQKEPEEIAKRKKNAVIRGFNLSMM